MGKILRRKIMNKKSTRTITSSLLLGLLLSLVPALIAGTLEGTVSAKDKTKVVIYVEGATGATPDGRVVMDQQNKLFIPYVLPVVKGTNVEFLNSDALQHNVFGVGDDEFDLGNWTKGIKRKYTFNKPGEVVILCNVHPEMEAYVLVLESPYFTQPNADGTFQIENVPAGSYTVRAWYKGKTKKKKVTVPATGSVTVAF
jgi:plastocyanin